MYLGNVVFNVFSVYNNSLKMRFCALNEESNDTIDAPKFNCVYDATCIRVCTYNKIRQFSSCEW